MRTVNLKNGNVFTLHESQKQLPISRYTDFQKYILQDSGIGSTIADVDKHFKILDSFLSAGQLEEARRERYNLHSNLYLTLNKINIEHISFACLVHSINGEEVSDFSESNLTRICETLSSMGLTQAHLGELLEEVKKNLILN